MTSDEIWKLPASTRDILRWDLSRRWRCALCDTIVYLRTPAVIGYYCCPGCGQACLRPWYLELPPAVDADRCMWCDEPIATADVVSILHMGKEPAFEYRAWHRECLQRSMIGGLNHLRGTCQCCGGTDDPDPPEMSKREAASVAVNYWRLTRVP